MPEYLRSSIHYVPIAESSDVSDDSAMYYACLVGPSRRIRRHYTFTAAATS